MNLKEAVDKYDKLILSCDCGSEGILLQRIDDEIFLSFWVLTWYAEQEKSFMKELLKRLKIAWTILRKGMYQYQEIILTQEDAGRLAGRLLGRVKGE